MSILILIHLELGAAPQDLLILVLMLGKVLMLVLILAMLILFPRELETPLRLAQNTFNLVLMLTLVSILREQGVPLKIGVGQSHFMLIFSRNNHGQFTDVDFVDVVVDVASLILKAYRPDPRLTPHPPLLIILIVVYMVILCRRHPRAIHRPSEAV